MTIDAMDRALLRAGALLFLFGLIEGAVVQSFTNPRMALSAHLTAVQSGIALMIVGVAWPALRLAGLPATIARSSSIAGMYLLWIGLTISAATGAGESLPIAGAGYRSDAVAQALVSAAVLGGSGIMFVGWSLIVLALFRRKGV